MDVPLLTLFCKKKLSKSFPSCSETRHAIYEVSYVGLHGMCLILNHSSLKLSEVKCRWLYKLAVWAISWITVQSSTYQNTGTNDLLGLAWAMSVPAVGQRRSFDGHLSTIRYVGTVQGTTGDWLGVEWDDASRGKHSGEHKGVRYFTCMNFLLLHLHCC